MDDNFEEYTKVSDAGEASEEENQAYDSSFFFIDGDYPIPEALPKSVQADVDTLEDLAKEGEDWVMFAHYVDLLESNIKCHVLDRKMSYDTGKNLLARYGIHLT